MGWGWAIFSWTLQWNLWYSSEKSGDKYKTILLPGTSFLVTLNKLYEVVWNIKRKPDSWRDSVLVQLPRGKKKKEKFRNRRHIHTKELISKYFMHMVSSLAKLKVFEELSAPQIGAVTGHQAQEHLFSMKSSIAMIEMKREAIALQLYDVQRCSKKKCW